METKQSADPIERVVEELKDLGGMEPAFFAAKFKGQGALSQAYRDLLATRIRQSRLLRPFERASMPPTQQSSSGGNSLCDNKLMALEAKALAALKIIRDAVKGVSPQH